MSDSSQSDPGAQVDVSVLVVNYNTAHLLRDMMSALNRARDGLRVDVIAVDNASRDDSVARLRDDPELAGIRLIANPSNVGFGRANNQLVPLATGRYLLLLNTDAFVSQDTLSKTVAFMDARPDCGVVGVRLIGRDGSLQPSCRYFPTPSNVFLHRSGLERWFPARRPVDDMKWDHSTVRECDWVPGCYLLIRKEVVDRIGLFDPRFFLYYEEVDLCLRAKRAGWKVHYVPDTSVVHLGGESAKSDAPLTAGLQISELQIESELLYFRKHFGPIGFAAFVGLSWLADAILAAKWLLRARRSGALRSIASHAASMGSLLVRTRLGSLPTR